MIYILKKHYGLVKRLVTSVYYDGAKAKAEHELIGGELIACIPAEDVFIAQHHIADLVADEVAAIIDELSTSAPGSPRELEPGSPEWDCYKLQRLNNIRTIIESGGV